MADKTTEMLKEYREKNLKLLKELRKEGEKMVWGVEEYNKAIQNYSQLLKEQPANADLLEKYQVLCLEKARLEGEEKHE
jgi:DNA-binding protein H-NS